MALNKRKVLEAARKHAQKGAKAKALKEYNKLLKEDPRDAKLLLEVGDAYRRWGQNDEAIAQYTKVAQQYRQDGFDARAVAVFKQILNLDSKNYAAYVSLSELYQRMGLDSEAVGALQTAADGYHKEGRKTEALELLRQMAALDPTNTTSRLKVAELLRQEGMDGEAVAEYQAVVEELENQQDRDQLIAVLERILEVQADDLDALTRLVRHLMAAGDLGRAEPLAVHALDVAADVPQYELLLELYAQMGDDTKLADATRDLAKLYRERGDEDRARELMQRLPADEMSSSSRLAVDVSEVDEPQLGDEELLDDDLLSQESPMPLSLDEGAESDPAAAPPALDLDLETDAPALDLEAPIDPEPAAAPEALPEGDPDQLLAEASVYLRYGKRDQAISSLRGVLAQEPTHRAALEKLGEAYADDGQNSEAVTTWLKAAAIVREAGDAEALSVLRDRIAALDPAMAEQVGEVTAGTVPPVEPPTESGQGGGVEFDLDVEVDLDLDAAIDEVSDSETHTGFDFGGSDDLEIELDDESLEFDTPPEVSTESQESTTPIEAKGAPSADESETFDLDDESFEFEVEAAGSGEDNEEPAQGDDASMEFDFDAGELSSPPTDAGAGQSAASAARIQEEIEEAEFYIAQQMYDEARGILERILAAVPNHPSALLRLGEVEAAEHGSADSAVAGASASGAGGSPSADFENTSRFGSEGAPSEAADSEEDMFEIDVDVDVGAELDMGVEDATDEDLATESLEAGTDSTFEIEVGQGDQDLAAANADVEIEVAPAAPVAVVEEPAIAEPSPPEVAEPAPAPPAEPAVEPLAADAATDPGDSFDLREALADVLGDEDDDSRSASNGESGVLSTVEDGFESIFSDFKKGVSATLEEGDYDTRYDLGIAYREMGLFEDAIGEFRVCLDSEARRFDSLYLMGLCARDLMRFDDAVSHLEQALALPDLPEERLAGVYFDLSAAQKGAGDVPRAAATMRRVLELDPDFPGAAERLTALEAGEVSSPELGAPGEAFESFDDLFSEEEDEAGDDQIVEAAPVEAFESFDDVVSEAEAVLDEAELADTSGETAPEEANETTDSNSTSKKSGRKKISFV